MNLLDRLNFGCLPDLPDFALRDDDARFVASAEADAGRAPSPDGWFAESGEGVTAGPTAGCADCAEGGARFSTTGSTTACGGGGGDGVGSADGVSMRARRTTSTTIGVGGPEDRVRRRGDGLKSTFFFEGDPTPGTR